MADVCADETVDLINDLGGVGLMVRAISEHKAVCQPACMHLRLTHLRVRTRSW